ncbi:MAG: response regulator transcription factor [Methylomonas sp.]|nr:response regulator transcription factor [Methylomonas sp.]
MKILLLDDHALFRAGLRLLLQTLAPAVEVLEAGDMDGALLLIARHADTALCLLDLDLRGQNGMSLIARIRQPTSTLGVVVVSAHDELATVKACIDAGAMSFISKAASPEQLATALRYVLAGQVYLPPHLFDSHAAEADSLKLTPRQRDVLAGLCQGLSTKAIARTLDLSEHTVKDYISGLFKLLDVHNRTEAVIKTNRLRLLREA